MNGFWPCLIMGIAAWAAIYNWLVTLKKLKAARRRAFTLSLELLRLKLAVFPDHDHWDVSEPRIIKS